MNDNEVRNIVEASLMVAQRPLSLDSLLGLFGEAGRPERGQIRESLERLRESYEGRGIELVEVASGYRIQVRQQLSEWVSRLWQERPPRYSRALLETLSLIAYRQPITRGEIEDIRGVSVSTNIMRTLLDRGWVRVLGTRDVPGKPAMYGTTREFLDYFGLKRLDDLPSLAELRDIDSINVELDLPSPDDLAERPSDEAGIAPEGPGSLEGMSAGVDSAAGEETGGDDEVMTASAITDEDVERADEAEGETSGSSVQPGGSVSEAVPGTGADAPEAEDAAPHVTSIPAETGPDDEPVDAAIDEDLATDEAGAGTGVVHATESAENQDSADADIDEKDRAEVADLPATR